MGWTRYHAGTEPPATADAAGIMAALATIFGRTTDVDTGAAISGLTWTRDTTAGSQAIYSSTFGPNNYRIIIAIHDSGSPASGPTMVTGADSYTAANVLIGLAVNASGAYANWYAAAPFTGCSFPGYLRLGPTAGATTGDIRCWVSTKDLWIQYRVSTSTIYTAHFGAVITGAAASTYAESDGYRYGGMVSGAGADMASSWRSNTVSTAGLFGKNGTSNGTPHAGLYSIAGTTWQTVTMEHIRFVSPATTDMAKWAAGVAANTGISFQRASSPEYSVGGWSGVSDGPKGITASVVNDTTPALWGWLLSATHTGAGEDTVIIRKTVP